MTRRSFVPVWFTDKLFVLGHSACWDWQNLKTVKLVIQVLWIYRVTYCCIHHRQMTVTSDCHLSHNLKLSRRTFFQFASLESHINRIWGLPCFNKWIWTQKSLIPLIDESLETEITEHCHVTLIQDGLKEFKHLFFALVEFFVHVSSTTFPVKHNATGMNFADVRQHLLGQFILRISLKSHDQLFNASSGGLIN